MKFCAITHTQREQLTEFLKLQPLGTSMHLFNMLQQLPNIEPAKPTPVVEPKDVSPEKVEPPELKEAK